jgi:hypothetical protein
MAVDPNLKRGFYAYLSDDGNTYQVGLSLGVANSGAFPDAAEGDHPGYPIGWKMRHVSCKDGTGQRCSIPISGNSDSRYVSGGLLDHNGNTFVIQGRIGERMTSKN